MLEKVQTRSFHCKYVVNQIGLNVAPPNHKEKNTFPGEDRRLLFIQHSLFVNRLPFLRFVVVLVSIFIGSVFDVFVMRSTLLLSSLTFTLLTFIAYAVRALPVEVSTFDQTVDSSPAVVQRLNPTTSRIIVSDQTSTVPDASALNPPSSTKLTDLEKPLLLSMFQCPTPEELLRLQHVNKAFRNVFSDTTTALQNCPEEVHREWLLQVRRALHRKDTDTPFDPKLRWLTTYGGMFLTPLKRNRLAVQCLVREDFECFDFVRGMGPLAEQVLHWRESRADFMTAGEAFLIRFANVLANDYFPTERDDPFWEAPDPNGYISQQELNNEILIDFNVLESTTGYHKSVLLQSYFNRDLRFFHKVLYAGADPDMVIDRTGRRFLHVMVATRLGLRGLRIQYLVNAGANVNVRQNDGQTPLMSAAEAGPGIRVKPLLNAGADLSLRDDDGRTALDHAIQNKNIVLYLMKEALQRGYEPETVFTPQTPIDPQFVEDIWKQARRWHQTDVLARFIPPPPPGPWYTPLVRCVQNVGSKVRKCFRRMTGREVRPPQREDGLRLRHIPLFAWIETKKAFHKLLQHLRNTFSA